jgi:hypothetical protein
MTPQDRLKQTIQAEASRDSSDFEVITHRGLQKKAKIFYGDFTKSVKSELDDWELQDEISFLNVEADFVSKGDPITFNSVDYEVKIPKRVIAGIYDIFATKKLRTGSMV